MSISRPWMSMPEWFACEDQSIKEEHFFGKRCFAGIAARAKTDLVAKILVFQEDAAYYVVGHYYISDAFVRSRQFEGWVRDDRPHRTRQSSLDFKTIREELKGDLQRFDLVEVGYIPAQLGQFAEELVEHGVPMAGTLPVSRNFSPAMKEIEALVACRRLHHTGDLVLARGVAGVVCDRAMGHICRVGCKDHFSGGIDPAIALMMALMRCLLLRPSEDEPEGEVLAL